ncbi:MAG: citrate/2-methylcitrate synthase [Acidimicrobiales bacterium]|jgi:citrate synthase
MQQLIEVPPGLAGVAVTDTSVGDVLGEQGLYHYRGRSAPELARNEGFESVAAFVLNGSSQPLRTERALPSELRDVVHRLDLRSALSLYGALSDFRSITEIDEDARQADAIRLISVMPTLVASTHHRAPVDPNPSLSHVADYLRMLHGTAASDDQVAALEAYFVLTIDHGFSNSTFATRVVASTGADLAACVLAGLGALSGPRHGAAVERVLGMFDAIGAPSAAEQWMKGEIASGRRLQGFGHSVYRTPDPRLELMRELGAALNPERHVMAMAAEQAGGRVLAGRRLAPNVDLHSAVVLEGCGVPRGLFAATFAAARMVGWCAHALEQAHDNKIIRPAARYVGPLPDMDIY